MLVHIIEDDDLKANRLLSFLKSLYDSFQFVVNASYQSGMKAMELEVPDILILDMTLPTFDRKPHQKEGRLRPLGGYEIMRKIKLRNVQTKVIIVTQLPFFDDKREISLEEITEKSIVEFPGIFMRSIYFDQSDVSWQKDLKSTIDSIIHAPASTND
ncbi:TPA: response regulator [Pseudomonas aeruginosa]|uniref:response regulator n=1 Tax=Pseudomonas aeruginosa TaxID=287 RepID=UPI00097E686E|nr:response regulator [Pseudomonas aeruginosa]MCS7704577.1 response regulator [Pseudomonas aeruginosa]MEA8473043.1 response regulator [Pseudomonas aeruginosa]ONN11857.1 hypothetical protein B0B18_25945 [Pseudomonas aeruginosa]RTU62985.1 response regulator [Pseudomonas aeruginosa]HBP0650773.1 response regulator [Pseudomonas aeruginosa]